jgi:hypothetical protein
MLFPQRRHDGSFSVAARFSAGSDDALKAARDYVAAWLDRKTGNEHVNFGEEFRRPIRVEPVGKHGFDIVFDCHPHSVMWKGWMVELTQRVRWIPGITFQGFWDLVSGAPHPASVPEE